MFYTPPTALHHESGLFASATQRLKLQYATAIASPMVWTDVENGTATMAGTSVALSDTPSADNRFYQVVVTVADK